MKIRLLILILLILLLSSCSKLNCTRLENLAGGEENLISLSYKMTDELVQTAYPPLALRNPYQPILITTLVDNNDLQQTSKFGRIMQEHMASRLVQLGYTVKEIKLRKSMLIEPESGETYLSRHLQNIKGTHDAQAVLVGTISHTNRTMYISTRLIHPGTSNIIASKDYKLCMDDTVLAMFNLQRTQGNGCLDCIDEPNQPYLNQFF